MTSTGCDVLMSVYVWTVSDIESLKNDKKIDKNKYLETPESKAKIFSSNSAKCENNIKSATKN